MKGQSAGEFYSILFFAVEQNSPELINILCTAGASPKDRVMPLGLPVLIYCVISAEYGVTDITNTLIALLAAGANPMNVPKDMWEKYVDASKTTDPKSDKASRKKVKDDWCKPEFRKALCRELTLFQRYCLWKASHLKLVGIRKRQVAETFSIQKLFEIHYHLVDQNPAAKQVIQIVINHFLSSFRRSLVLLFAGPSGHGKTELSRRMDDLLSLPLQYIDCTEMKHETDIFGPKPPYIGCDKSSPLNSFLVEHAGLKSIVFLDEFDKTIKEVRNSMLLTLDTGHYKNRVDGTPLDCSKVIWIMATNKGDEQIQRFWDEHLADTSEERQLSAPMHILQSRLSRTLIDEIWPSADWALINDHLVSSLHNRRAGCGCFHIHTQIPQ